MRFVSRGFRGKRREPATTERLPPGQYVVTDFPVLSAGPTRRVNLAQWTFSIEGEIDAPRRWTWDEFLALPAETVTRDIHCVTKWSKFDTTWKGVSVDTLMRGVDTAAEFITAFAMAATPPTCRRSWVSWPRCGRAASPSTTRRR